MTARAGDALSHVYFSWPPTHLSSQFSEAISCAGRWPTSGHDLPLPPRPEGPISRKLNGSARICIGAMNLRNRANLPPAVYLPQLGAPH